MNIEPTLHDVLDALSDFSSHVDERFDSLESRFSSLDSKVTSMDTRLSSVEVRVSRMESQMVTKDYLDRKVDSVRGDLVALVRKEDQKVNALARGLEEEGILSKQKTAEVISLGPFPR